MLEVIVMELDTHLPTQGVLLASHPGARDRPITLELTAPAGQLAPVDPDVLRCLSHAYLGLRGQPDRRRLELLVVLPSRCHDTPLRPKWDESEVSVRAGGGYP